MSKTDRDKDGYLKPAGWVSRDDLNPNAIQFRGKRVQLGCYVRESDGLLMMQLKPYLKWTLMWPGEGILSVDCGYFNNWGEAADYAAAYIPDNTAEVGW